MIKDPPGLVFVLLSVEAMVLFLGAHSSFKRLFRFVPAVFWIYFLPMLISSAGIIDAKSPLYARAVEYLLPASLFLLLVDVDIKGILKLGRPAILMFFAGSAGIMAGTVLVVFMFKGIMSPDAWLGFGALSASWMGGSANMIAVKEAIGTPDAVFLPMVVVDTVVPYVWMGILVSGCGVQKVFNRWNRARQDLVVGMEHLSAGDVPPDGKGLRWEMVLLVLAVALAAGMGARWLGQKLPQSPGVISAFTWTVILVSTAGLVGSMTPAKALGRYGSSRIGYALLYFVLATIGARSNIGYLGSSGLLIAAGFMIIAVHAVFLLAAARMIRAPLFLAAVASQANVGGVASAPIVAEIYQSGLSAVGLLMAVMGNIAGTYLGMIVAQLCRLVSGGN